MSLSARFPEVSRYAMSELRRPRLILAAVVSFFIGSCLLGIEVILPQTPTLRLFDWAFLLQAAAILLYGTSRITGSVITERIEKTWEVQRLTPQSSFELALGKLLGAPVFAYFLAALMLPWAAIGAGLSDKVDAGAVVVCYAALLSVSFLTLSLGLLVSAHSTEAAAGSAFNMAGALTGFLAFTGVQFLFTYHEGWKQPIEYFGAPWPPQVFLCASAAAIGVWAFLGAQWRLGSDLREGRRIWRLPAFLAFLVVYQAGFPAMDIYLSAILPAFIAFFAATLNSERREHWRRWLSGGGHWLHDVPTWIAACASYAALAVLLVLFGKASGEKNAFWRYPILQSCFLIRDCAFIQYCRFTNPRRPEITALIFIGLAYLLPPIALIAFFEDPLSVAFLFSPLSVEKVGALANLLPAVLQAGGALCLLHSILKRQKLSQDYPEL